MTHTLNLQTLTRLADLQRAAEHNKRVRWEGTGESVLEGVARHFTDVNGNFLRDDADVRTAFLRVSGTVEHFLPVSDVLSLMTSGLFVTEL
jgi:hypothetical protein